MDNLENGKKEALPQEDNPQNGSQDVYTAEQRERHLQQLEGSKKEAERKDALLLETYKDLASQDASYLDKLAEKDPKMADKVAKEFEYDSYEDLKNSMSPKDTNKGFGKEDFDKMYQERRAKEVDDEARAEAQAKINKLPAELQEKAQSYFDRIAGTRQLTRADATEFADMATLYVNRDKISEGKSDEFYSAMANAGVNVSKPSKPKEEGYVIQGRKLVPLDSK